MKAFSLTLIVISFSIICVLNISLVSAVEQDELSVTPIWSTSTPYQGSSPATTLRLISTYSEQLKIYRVGIHFDWMPSDSFFTLDLSNDPVVVPSQGLHIFEMMVIQIPANVSVGSHSYYVAIDGTEAPYYDSFTWDSSFFTVQILESSSKVYDTMLTQLDNDINSAVNALYQNDEAKNLLAQAQNKRAEAVALANAGKWEEAISNLQQASNHLEQAELAEQLNAEQNAGLQTLLLYLGIIAIVVVIVVTIVMVLRKKRKTDEAVDQTVDQTVDEQPEWQDYSI